MYLFLVLLTILRDKGLAEHSLITLITRVISSYRCVRTFEITLEMISRLSH